MNRLKLIMIGLLMAFLPIKASAQLLAVSTDLVGLLTQTYNAGVELTVSNRSTLGVSILGNYHPWVLKSMRAIAVQPEWRYYFSGRPMMRHFIGVCGLLGNCDMEWKDEHYIGDVAGAGVTFGYVMPLSERLNIDFHAGLGLMFYHRKDKESVDDIISDNAILPLKFGVSLSYILK